jgi:hypothetical protein
MIHNLSKCSVFIELYFTQEAEKPLAIGTAFTIKSESNDWFLITNWHCVTGRNPESKIELSGLADPKIIKVHFHSSIILPKSWTKSLVKKSLNLTKQYDQTNPTQIHT